MANLINFFMSFDKLMKEKLVKAFYWLALLNIALVFASHVFHKIWLKPVAGLLEFIGFFVTFLMLIVGLRLAAELAIALFRINDNLSPDGGLSETADIDPLEEAKKAAEEAAKRARTATNSVVSKTRSATSDLKSNVSEKFDNAEDSIEDAVEKARETVKKTASKTPTPKKTTAKKATTTKSATNSDSPRLKKDGTPAKKPGPKKKT